MSHRRLPVHPDLEALQYEASALDDSNLDHARLTLAQSYGAPSWERLEQSCRIIDAIWRDDLETVRALILEHPDLIHEDAGIGNRNWGPPLSYAANLGRDRIILLLHEHGATDLEQALDRALLQSRTDTARMLHLMMGSPKPTAALLGGAAYTLSVSGAELYFELGGELERHDGVAAAPVDVVLETDGRRPTAKHRILELFEEHGYQFPDTAPMALHRGRIDLLEEQLRRDPDLLQRTFRYEELFPPAIGCHEESLPRTSLDGATLLHLAVDLDELEIARWLLAQGMPVDTAAATDDAGFGGQTALFHAVVCFANFWDNLRGVEGDAPFARLFLEHGARPDARASLRERIFVDQQPAGFREHKDLTPAAWGEVYHNRLIVNRPTMALLAELGAT